MWTCLFTCVLGPKTIIIHNELTYSQIYHVPALSSGSVGTPVHMHSVFCISVLSCGDMGTSVYTQVVYQLNMMTQAHIFTCMVCPCSNMGMVWAYLYTCVLCPNTVM